MGKRIKSLDTGDNTDPVRAIREIVQARKEQMIRKGKDISALEVQLRELQVELEATQKALGSFQKKAVRQYGTRNKLVTRTEYDNIIARRKKEVLVHKPAMGAAYVPNAQDFSDMAKIGLFHLEAMGRDFAKWSYQMTRDFGEWITPHLQDEYDKALGEAKEQGVEIKESKRLTAKKKRLATVTGKIEAKLEAQDLARVPRIPIELDEEGQRLQTAYDLAREKYKAAQAVANLITEKEVRIIAQLAKEASERKSVMEKSPRRKENKGPTDTEWDYGIAISLFLEHIDGLKSQATKRTFMETVRAYLNDPINFVSDIAGTGKALLASLDDSFIGRQGLRTFLKGLTGDTKSMKIWIDTATRSFKVMWQTLGRKKVMRMLFAEMISDPEYDLLKKARIALDVVEEEIPVDIPSRIPFAGMAFRMGENAFVASSRYMRYRLGKYYFNVWRKSGRPLDKQNLLDIGRISNSQTGRGKTGARSQKPGFIDNVFWSTRNLKAHIDTLTAHLFNRNMSWFARRQAAINLLRYISGAAMILALANWLDDDSVTWNTKSADFGKIRIGDTRFSVGGGMEILVILASRLITREFTSSVTGKTKSIDTGKYGALTGGDLVFNFFENKFSPAAQLAWKLFVERRGRMGEPIETSKALQEAVTPLIIQNVMETKDSEESANILAALIAETLGVNVQTYDSGKKKTKKRTKI